MENSTIISLLTTTGEGNISSPENQQKVRKTTVEWIVAQCISAVVTALALYLVVALTCFELKKRGYSFGKNLESQPGKTTNSSAEYSPTKSSEGIHQKQSGGFKIRKRNKGNHEDRYENWLRMMSLSAATFAMWKCLSLQMDMFWGTTTVALCTVFTYFTVTLNGMSLISVYLLLWLRQWAVHSHPALQHLPVKRLRRISWLLLGLMIVTFIALCVFFYITIQVVPSARGCIYADGGTVSQGTRSASGIVFTAIYQPALLGLLFYPLLKHTINTKRAFHNPAAESNKQKDDSEAKIYKLIRRLLIIVFLCTISDVGGVIAAFLLEDHPLFYLSLVYDVNITFGAYVIVCSFNDWRQRVLPWYEKKHAPKKNNRENELYNVQTSK